MKAQSSVLRWYVTNKCFTRNRSNQQLATPATRSKRECADGLLRMHDLAGDELALTQEFLAQMMGVRRTSVSLVANTLQNAGLISYRRGKIKLLNIEAITQAACECYSAVRKHYDAMLKEL
jgi:CRP-like cAMP-binding protein